MPKIADSEEETPRTSQRGIYLLPNLLTTAALFSGFYSIVAAMKGQYETAAMAIVVAMIADGLDGRVARLTNTQTAFGAQYDSLSDMIAFGLAPSLGMYVWSLNSLGKVGWVAAFLFTAAAALRLARFNTQVNQVNEDKIYFQGLSSTSAAGCIASVLWLGSTYGIAGSTVAIFMAVLMLVMASLMVSSIRYSSFKSIDFKGRVPFFTAVVAVCILTAVALEPAEILFMLFFGYVISGPILTLWKLRKMKKLARTKHKK